MTDIDNRRRTLLKLLGLAGASASTAATAASVPSDANSPTTDNRQIDSRAVSLRRAPLGPQQISLTTERGRETLAQFLFRSDPAVARHGDVFRQQPRSGVTSASSASADERFDLVVAVTGQGLVGDSRLGDGTPGVPADATLDIWAGSYTIEDKDTENEFPQPGSDDDVEVAVQKPDGSTDTLTVPVTDPGLGRVAYDLDEHGVGSGTYNIEPDIDDDVETPGGGFASAAVEFTVGPTVTLLGSAIGDTRLRNRETRLPVLARTGTEPAAGVEATVRVEHSGETVHEETVTTGTDGVAATTMTPEGSGSHQVSVERDGDVVAEHDFDAVGTVLATSDSIGGALAGHENFFGGYLYTASGTVTDTAFDLRIEGQETTVVDRTVETDESGFLTVNYDVPADIGEGDTAGTLDIEATLDGEPVTPQPSDFINVTEDESQDNQFQDDIQVELDGQVTFPDFFAGPLVAPGGSASVSLTLEDDEAVPEASVELAFQFQAVFDGGPVFDVRTVTTGADGTASLTVPVPENAPDGASLRVTARADVGGETRIGTASGSIRSTNLSVQRQLYQPDASLPAPGKSEPISFEATEMATGDPASGQHQHLDFQYSGAFNGPFAALHQETGVDGTDETPLTVPEDIQFFAQYRLYNAYMSGELSVTLPINYPGEISMPETVVPGETVEVSFDIPTGQTASGFVSVASFNPVYLFGTKLASDEPTTLEIPENVDDSFPFTTVPGGLFEEDFLPVTVAAATPDGTLYSDIRQITVADSDDPDSGGDDSGDGPDNGSDSSSDGPDNGSDSSSDDGFGPGFDVAGAVASLGALGYLVKRRIDTDRDGDTRD